MQSVTGGPSVALWLASACIAFMGARAFADYLRRTFFRGPIREWRDLLLGAAALTSLWWAAMIVDIGAQGLAFDVGYHPLKVFGVWLAGWLGTLVLVFWVTWRPAWPSQVAAAVLSALLAVVVQIGVIWSIGAEPGLQWRTEPLVFALLLLVVGQSVGCRMVIGVRRGSKNDRASRRLMAALVLGACTVAAQELVLAASGLEQQVVSAHARFLPEVIVSLVAGAAVPIALVLMLVDQRTQQRARASERARRKRLHGGDDAGESVFNDSTLASLQKAQNPPRQ